MEFNGIKRRGTHRSSLPFLLQVVAPRAGYFQSLDLSTYTVNNRV